MGAIRNKLRSERGASILLALLFFLLCAMVGASVLMAAASNAGKSRSNREEQQKYLTLSSAMQLVCDELTHEQTEYKAKYRYVYNETKEPIRDDKGNVVGEKIVRIDHIYTQLPGEFAGELSTGADCVLPLLPDLDWLFGDSFPENTQSGITYYTYNKLTDNQAVKEPEPHDLRLTVTDQPDDAGLSEPVTVTVELKKDGEDKWRFSIRAEFANDPSYKMYAKLLNSNVPALTASQGTHECAVTWSLSQITREEPT